ncbi:MAG: DUF4232 domain-containing protein [Catenulispora sp.]
MRPEQNDGNAAIRRAAWLLTAVAVGVVAAGCGGSSGSSGSAKPAGSTSTSSSTIASTAGSSGSPTSSGPASASATDSSAASGSGPACAAPGATARLDQLPGAAAGSTFWDIVVTNHGTAACTLTAQPAVSVLDPSHQQLPIKVNTDSTAKAITVAPGASAVTVLAYGSDANPPCASKTSYLLVTPPGIELAFRDSPHCEHDTVALSGWVPGEHGAPG